MNDIYNLAFDFGASSGRLMLSVYDGKVIELKEIHRFSNQPVWLNGKFYWDFLRLFHEMKEGLKKASKLGVDIAGVGIDTWGVDYGLIDKQGQLLSNPFCYRDPRTVQIREEVKSLISDEQFYQTTGLQLMDINTVYQLKYDIKTRKEQLKDAKAMLFMPDLFSYFLCGALYSEYSIASTSQMLDATTKQWSEDIINKLNIPKNLLQKIVMPGTVVGKLKEEIQKETEMKAVPVIAVGGHDTQSAICSTPLESDESVYISCGTWSLLGIEVDKPIINDKSFKYNFTNEGGVENKICFLKNITGLWIIQQLKKKWAETNKDIDYPDIIKAAMETTNKNYEIDPNDDRFSAPLNMVQAVQSYCEEKGQGKPETIGEIAIAAYNGITNKYKEEVLNIEKISNKKIEEINMVGGGIQDHYLCQLTADKTGKNVIAGPIEASVLGNILMQLKALGHVKSLKECRKIIKNSFTMEKYYPSPK